MMEAANTSETLVTIYWITRRYNPEDSHQQVIISNAVISLAFPDIYRLIMISGILFIT
jgi:dTDP-4-dehydrorhamnose 3,5-epimerase-like enzyme